MRLLLAISVFLVSTASAVSIGFLNTTIPAHSNEYIVQLETDEDIYMLTIGEKVGPSLNVEASFGWETEAFDENSSYPYSEYSDKTVQAYGLGAFYRLTGNDYVSFSLGARFIYSDLEFEKKNYPNGDKIKTTAKTFSPLARIDLTFPGVENLFLHTQFGFNYRKVDFTMDDNYYYSNEIEMERADFSITSPKEILAGIYYQF